MEASQEPLGTALSAPVSPAVVPGSVRELIGLRQAFALIVPAGTEAEAIDRIRALEQLKAACAAAQVRETHALDTLRRTAEAARGVPANQQCRGLAGEIGLARSESPHRGSRLLSLARSLTGDLPCTLEALTGGMISEAKAAVVHRETAWLPTGTHRTAVDAALADRLPFLGPKQLARQTRHHAINQDPHAALEHYEKALTERRVTVRPIDNGMATLSATLPLVQAAACHRALAEVAASTVALGEAEGRTGHQVMADVLVERLTGQATAAQVPVEVHLVMTDTALLGEDSTPARIPGHGSVPAAIARRLLTTSTSIGTGPGDAGQAGDAAEFGEVEVFLRRLYTAPGTGQLVAMDSTRRAFPALLRRMVILRDELCRTPYCDAQIQHLDHATPHAKGGTTSWANASGLCARCNHTKEHPGWIHTADPQNLEVATPTGHQYHHPAPPLTTAPEHPAATPSPRPRRFPGVTPLRFSLRQVRALLDAA